MSVPAGSVYEEEWKMSARRRITADMTVNQALEVDRALVKVFTKHRIDACCGGAERIGAAAAAQGLDVEKVLIELNEAVSDAVREGAAAHDVH